MKVVFLDIDGVLVNKRSWFIRSGSRATADPPAALNEITDRANAVIVVSSTWRIGMSIHSMEQILRSFGVTANCVGLTPVLGTARGKEIAVWLKMNKHVKRFVILDDDDDMGPLSDKLVQTIFDDGLSKNHVARALQILDAAP